MPISDDEIKRLHQELRNKPLTVWHRRFLVEQLAEVLVEVERLRAENAEIRRMVAKDTVASINLGKAVAALENGANIIEQFLTTDAPDDVRQVELWIEGTHQTLKEIRG